MHVNPELCTLIQGSCCLILVDSHWFLILDAWWCLLILDSRWCKTRFLWCLILLGGWCKESVTTLTTAADDLPEGYDEKYSYQSQISERTDLISSYDSLKAFRRFCDLTVKIEYLKIVWGRQERRRITTIAQWCGKCITEARRVLCNRSRNTTSLWVHNFFDHVIMFQTSLLAPIWGWRTPIQNFLQPKFWYPTVFPIHRATRTQ